MEPPWFVAAIGESDPSVARRRRVEEEGSKVMFFDGSKRSKPAKEPATPTVPMRVRSIFGVAAFARSGERRKARVRSEMEEGLDINCFIAGECSEGTRLAYIERERESEGYRMRVGASG